MTLRPVPARWFEVLVSRDDTVMALETLAATDSVELEVRADAAVPLCVAEVEGELEQYQDLEHRYSRYWPQTEIRPSGAPGAPSQTLARALDRLKGWAKEAEPLVHRREELEAERSNLLLLEELLRAMPHTDIDLGHFSEAGVALGRRVFVLPPGTVLEELPQSAITLEVTGDRHKFLIGVGAPEQIDALAERVEAASGRPLPIPEWLSGSGEAALRQIEERLTAQSAEMAGLTAKLDTLERRHQLREALGDVRLVKWYLGHVRRLPGSENFCWITGWTSDIRGTRLPRDLRKAHVRAVIRFPEAPRDAVPPTVMYNPWWAKPFELFPKLMGMPAENEVDPTFLLAIIVPLLFGYMFGDVGHGLVLTLAGVLMRRRWPQATLLVFCGLSAMLFGWMFGSVFSREDLISALWVNPVEHPLPVLVIPLLGGVLLMVLGLMLGAVESQWAGVMGQWLRVDAGVLVLYLGALATPFYDEASALVVLGLVWYLAGSAWEGRGAPFGALAAALGKLLESILQLAVNTLSFARVGAFALAHAGLSLATVTLTAAVGNRIVAALVFVIGNVLSIVLEALVVSIQTTRLVLFEFFIRFLRAEGRIFRPLIALPTTLRGENHESAS